MTPRLRLAAASRSIQPFRQGDLDGLSALYALINAVRILLHPRQHVGRRAAAGMFAAGLVALHRSGQLLRCTVRDVDQGARALLVDAVHEQVARRYAVKLELVLLPSAPSLRPTSSYIRHAIRAGSPVLMKLAGSPPHWTVAVRNTATRLSLFDSAGRRWLVIRHLDVAAEPRPRIAELYAWRLISAPDVPTGIGDASETTDG
jgi:hypothetical protein